MGKTAVAATVGFLLAGVALTGCQSSDSGSGSRMLAKQPAYVNPPMNNYATTMPGNKSLGISDTNGRPGMSTSSSVQQTGGTQVVSPSSGGQSPITSASAIANPTATGFDQGGQVISKQMGNSTSSSAASGPVPPPTPGGYTIPTPSAYTPPANPNVPTRKPGDDL
jgi:hypothetical protein